VRQRLALVDASFEVKIAVKNDDISIKTATDIVKESGGDLHQQDEQLKSAPKKNKRRPRRALIEIIIDDYLPKLTDDELTNLAQVLSEKYYIYIS
jgi:hypothetical protein